MQFFLEKSVWNCAFLEHLKPLLNLSLENYLFWRKKLLTLPRYELHDLTLFKLIKIDAKKIYLITGKLLTSKILSTRNKKMYWHVPIDIPSVKTYGDYLKELY